MSFLVKVCAFFFAAGLLGLVYVSVDHFIFGNDGPYPDLTEDGGTFADYLLQVGTLTLGAGLIGAALYSRFGLGD